VGGPVKPSAFAVLRLVVNSIVVGCSNTARGSSSPVPIKGTGYWKVLVARWVRIVSAAWRVIGTCGSSADGSSTDAYRHSPGYGCTPVNATAINAAVISTTAMHASATASISEGVS
jgi:hypothetical protein